MSRNQLHSTSELQLPDLPSSKKYQKTLKKRIKNFSIKSIKKFSISPRHRQHGHYPP